MDTGDISNLASAIKVISVLKNAVKLDIFLLIAEVGNLSREEISDQTGVTDKAELNHILTDLVARGFIELHEHLYSTTAKGCKIHSILSTMNGNSDLANL